MNVREIAEVIADYIMDNSFSIVDYIEDRNAKDLADIFENEIMTVKLYKCPKNKHRCRHVYDKTDYECRNCTKTVL